MAHPEATQLWTQCFFVVVVDKHRFCVIFGSGQNKFRTDIVEDLFDNPVFNTECEVLVCFYSILCYFFIS
jgi:hypothetical protein